MKIAAVLMVKNESKRIHVTLDSIREQVDALIVLDTGSTDDTLQIIHRFAKTHGMRYHVKTTAFVNFEVSRNELLEFCEKKAPDVDWLLLLDCNDELRVENGTLRQYLELVLLKDPNAPSCLVRQEWWSGTSTTYYNMRLVKNNAQWRYKGVVHEYITRGDVDAQHTFLRLDGIVIYQDRTQDDDKTQKRFSQDYVMLKAALEEDPNNARSVFYMAQTLACLQKLSYAYDFYLKRTAMGGFQEEVIQSYIKLGMLTHTLINAKNIPDEHRAFVDLLTPAMGNSWFLRAFEMSKRVEPLVQLGKYYQGIRDFFSAYMFYSMACTLPYPSHCILFVDRRDYTYNRWHGLGVVAYYCGQYTVGRYACGRAIAAENQDIDKFNLKFYMEKEYEPNTAMTTIFMDNL